MELVMATQNKHKVAEISALLPASFEIKTLDEIGCFEEIPETEETLEGNALQKARYVAEKYGVNCFADDTGLEIEALDGAPGVYSARYAGPAKDSDQNMNLVLEQLNGKRNRKAQFKTVIALIINGKESCFQGEVKGEIRHGKSGVKGFGYDPIFQPEGYTLTFSEISLDEKNAISHRGKAVRKLVDYLSNQRP
jgi:XTP/dITP diphosphohydrolase